MSDAPRPPSHVWRWHDEDPEAIVLLVLIIVAIVFIPFKGCGLGSSDGDARPVANAAAESIEEGLLTYEGIDAPQENDSGDDAAVDNDAADAAPIE